MPYGKCQSSFHAASRMALGATGVEVTTGQPGTLVSLGVKTRKLRNEEGLILGVYPAELWPGRQSWLWGA